MEDRDLEETPLSKFHEDGSLDLNQRDSGMNSRRAFLRELRKVVDNSDVILHVLDARDPIGTRSSAIEEMALSTYNKKLVYVLNKSDLVPRDILVQWLNYLRKFNPTLLFKCNTQNQKGNLSRMSGKISKMEETAIHNTSHAIGTEELLNILKNYARTEGSGGASSKGTISVGIVGFPNVGKSSLINSLLRIRKVGVSPVPGFTKQYQEVILDKNIRLIDCPGVVFAEENEVLNSSAAALRNCVNVDELVDVFTPMQAILDRCPQSYLIQLYNIPAFKDRDVNAFLSLVAHSTGKLKKGGIPNTDMVARSILHDWNTGKIKYYCRLPMDENGHVLMNIIGNGNQRSTITEEEAAMVDSEAKILPGYSNKTFTLDDFNKDPEDVDSGMEVEGVAGVINQLDNDELCDYVGISSSDAPAVKKVETKKKKVLDTVPEMTKKTKEEVATDRNIKQIKKNILTEKDVSKYSAAEVMNREILGSSNEAIEEYKVSSGNNRKLQKNEKKKQLKAQRRTTTGTSEKYDFDMDFEYN